MANVADDIRANLEKQIGDLKKEISKISRSLTSQAMDVVDDVDDSFQDHRGQTRQLVRHARDQVRDRAHAVADVARENPGTTATVLTTVGLLGLTVGLVLGGVFASNNR